MGLISLPIMLRYGYDTRLATGVIAASGTLAQIIPPSLVLIIMADQLGRSVGDMYKGAFIPGFVLTGLYVAYVVLITLVKPKWAPALPAEARTIKEPSGSSGLPSLLILAVLSVAAAVGFAYNYPKAEAPTDEVIVVCLSVGVGMAFVLAVINKLARLNLLSRMAEKVTFVLIPPLALIFLVLGTIFLGVATPTEGGAMGATGALIMALSRKRLNLQLMKQAMTSTAKLTAFVVFILVGARVFSLTFYGVDGHVWVEHLLSDLPGGQVGFLIVVNILVFLLAFFLDFFELAFIVVPLLGPVAEKLGIDLIWFGVLLGVNMQTSFMHPPFGFALFYLRSVAPKSVKTTDIYWGAVPFVIIQVIMVGLVIAFPQMVTMGLGKQEKIDLDKIKIEIPVTDYGTQEEQPPQEDGKPGDGAAAPADEDPMAAIQRALKEEAAKQGGGKPAGR
ncbi:MAG: TRAP transporter large permease, partial [Pseudomonadota bacterium]